MRLKDFNPDRDIPDLTGKVILVTGGIFATLHETTKINDFEGTSGIGRATVLELAKHHPQHIYFTGRNKPAAEEVVKACTDSGTESTFLPCDLADLASIQHTATLFTSPRLDVFIANAGIMLAPPSLTKDGIEIHFGTNHLGNTALLYHLLPVMIRTAESPDADVRYVALTSLGYRAHPWRGIVFDSLRTEQRNLLFGGWSRYGQSKLANILTARELARRYPQITSVAVHPGIVKTNLTTSVGFMERVFVRMLSPLGLLEPEEGCFNTLWAATAPGVREEMEERRVAFFTPVGNGKKGDGKCWDDELARRLWEWTEKEVGVRGGSMQELGEGRT